MASSRSSASSSRRTKLTKSTNPTDVSSKARRSSAYDDDFEQHLIDYNVYLEGYEYPNDPVPDFFDGARPGDIDKSVREDLSKMIT